MVTALKQPMLGEGDVGAAAFQRLSCLSVSSRNAKVLLEAFEVVVLPHGEVGRKVDGGVLLCPGPKSLAGDVGANAGLKTNPENGKRRENAQEQREQGHQQHQ